MKMKNTRYKSRRSLEPNKGTRHAQVMYGGGYVAYCLAYSLMIVIS